MNPFPTDYYVYEHFDPDTFDTLYVGMGRGSRAYATKTTKAKQAAYGHRSPEHSKHLDELMLCEYLPHEWIKFHYRNLEKKEALVLEKQLIKSLKPMYNRSTGATQLKFNKDQVIEMKSLRDDGLYYSQIAEKMGCSPMVAHRIVNDRSPRYTELFND